MNEPLEPLVKELAEAHRRSLRGDNLAAEIERRLSATAVRAPHAWRRVAQPLILVAALSRVAAALIVASKGRAPEPVGDAASRAAEAQPVRAPLAF